MAVIDDLVNRIDDEALREKIKAELARMTKHKKFGLVFEEHLPECTPLYNIPVKVNSRVIVKGSKIKDILRVVKVNDGVALCCNEKTHEIVEHNTNEIVCVAEFGEPIYPYLQQIDFVCNAPDSSLWHTLIEADNYHALQLLEYLYAGKVDCIYIDPPYNSGAKDWKYNNDYVDANDNYRHSKWLSMMQKRLKLAKKLLNPNDSVLIVTIDEKEYLHLGCLLEEMFPEANIQMISSVINPSGTKRLNEFSRNDEYIFFVMIGQAVPSEDRTLNLDKKKDIVWETFRRHDLQSKRGTKKGGTAQFYPIYVDDRTKRIVKIGEAIAPDVELSDVPSLNGCTTVLPIRDNGIEMNWGAVANTARKLLEKGYLRVGEYKKDTPQKYVIKYLTSGTIDDIKNNVVTIDGYREDGSIMAHYEDGQLVMPKTNWNVKEYNANIFGSKILKNIVGERFNFPKSLYAVRDCIRYFVGEKSNALIVDFFAGSGTTLHAVNLLNAEDGGHRRCIMVTNNEVSAEEADKLTKQGFHVGDEEWEKYGIARYVNWPRTVCSIEGHDIEGQPIEGKYIGSDLPMSEGFKSNAVYFKLGFLDKTAVALGRQFRELLPLLWLKAGAHGECPVLKGRSVPNMLILPNNKFAVLTKESSYLEFAEQIKNSEDIQTIYIITDSENSYCSMVQRFEGKTTYQLYRDYLDNFRINAGGR